MFYNKFECPKCGSHQFGSRKNRDSTLTRSCHGNGQWNCEFEFNSVDDDLYFTEIEFTLPSKKGTT